MPRPNILFVIADQLRWDCMSVAGNPDVRTPTLDALAADGLLFENAFCAAPLCTPSRYTMVTGLLPHEHGANHNGDSISSSAKTFPEVLRDAGWTTATVGKSHFTPTYMDVGYDRMVLAEQDGAGRLRDDYHRALRSAGYFDFEDVIDQRSEVRRSANHDYFDSFGTRTTSLPPGAYSTTWITDRALEVVDDSWGEGGNLLTVGYIKPHHPFDPPAPWDAMYDPDSLSILPGWTGSVPPADQPGTAYFDNRTLTESALRRVMAAYYGTISQLDYELGRIVDTLKSRGLYDSTVIAFTADHGEYLGFHHLLLKHGRMYDPTVRVPLIVKPLESADPDRVGHLVTTADLPANLLRAVGVQSALPGQPWQLPRQHVVAESAESGYMIRTDRYKLCIDSAGDVLLFDLENDPLEMHDIAADSPNEVADLLSALVVDIGFDQLERRHCVVHPRGEIMAAPPADSESQQEWITAEVQNPHPWLDNPIN